MTTLLIIVHVVVCLFLVVIVLLQHGKGADVGATFGGSSESIFGTEGPVPLMNKITTGAAVLFMVTSISLAYFSAHNRSGSVMEELPVPPPPVEETAPPLETGPVTIPLPGGQAKVEETVPPLETGPVTVPLPDKQAQVKEEAPAAFPGMEEKPAEEKPAE